MISVNKMEPSDNPFDMLMKEEKISLFTCEQSTAGDFTTSKEVLKYRINNLFIQ